MPEISGVVWTVELLQTAEMRDYRPRAFVGRLGSLWGMVRIRRGTLHCECWVQDDARPQRTHSARVDGIIPAMSWCSEMILEERDNPGNTPRIDVEAAIKKKRRGRRYPDQIARKAAFDVLHVGLSHGAMGRLVGSSVSTISRISRGLYQISDDLWEKMGSVLECEKEEDHVTRSDI